MNKNSKSRNFHRSTPSLAAKSGVPPAAAAAAVNNGNAKNNNNNGSSLVGANDKLNPSPQSNNLEIRNNNSNREISDLGSARATSMDSIPNGYENPPGEDDLGNGMERDKILNEEMTEIWRMATPIEEARTNKRISMLKHILNLHVLSKITLRRFRVRVLDDSIVFPRFIHGDYADGQTVHITGLKISRLTASFSPNNATLDDLQEEILPNANTFNGLFGYNLIQSGTKEIVVVGRESDAMVIYQATRHFVPTVVLPDAGGPLSYDAVPYLDTFAKSTFWFPTVFYNRVKLFTRRLPAHQRCFVVSPKISALLPADLLANETNMTVGYDRIVKVLGIAEIVPLRDIETFASLKEVARDYVFGTGKSNGVAQWKRFSVLNNYLKGFRLGELTILSGPTGCGKTTFLSEYSLDLCEQNISTLWCSFEIANSRLVSIMVTQMAKKELVSTSGAEFDFWYDKLMQLPMFFAKFDITTPVKRIIEAIEHKITTHDIQHVVIDNVQVINTYCDTYKSSNSFRQADLAFSGADEICNLFRNLSTFQNVHVTIVVHPNRENEEITGITIGSLYGTVKASQSADNIFIMQKKYYRFKDMFYEKYFQIWKNRYAGEVLLGERLQMYFDSRNKCHKLILRSKKTSSKE